MKYQEYLSLLALPTEGVNLSTAKTYPLGSKVSVSVSLFCFWGSVFLGGVKFEDTGEEKTGGDLITRSVFLHLYTIADGLKSSKIMV